MIEDLRVGLFAQGVGVPRPVSEQRVYKAIDKALDALSA
jgi:ATP-dependent helicase HrpA